MWRDHTLHCRREDLDNLDLRSSQLFAEREHKMVEGSLAGTVVWASGHLDKSQHGRHTGWISQCSLALHGSSRCHKTKLDSSSLACKKGRKALVRAI